MFRGCGGRHFAVANVERDVLKEERMVPFFSGGLARAPEEKESNSDDVRNSLDVGVLVGYRKLLYHVEDACGERFDSVWWRVLAFVACHLALEAEVEVAGDCEAWVRGPQ